MSTTIATLGAMALLAVAAPAAHAEVRVGRSIAGVELGMTRAQVREVLGTPTRIVYPRNEIQGAVVRMDYGLTRVFLTTGVEGTTYLVRTTSHRQRTARSVGVGTTVRTLLHRVPGVRCERLGGLRACHVGDLVPGATVTDFGISRAGHVTSVSLGIVID